MSTGGSKLARGCRWILVLGHQACSEEERRGASLKMRGHRTQDVRQRPECEKLRRGDGPGLH